MFLYLYYYVNTRARTHACTRARVLRTVERAGLHAPRSGQLRFNLCHWDAPPHRAMQGARILWGVLFALVSVTVVAVFVPWREYQFYRGRERVCARVSADFSFDS